MKSIVTSAIILRRMNYGEADRILTVLTPEHGKISLLAKGVRKAKSKLAGGLELFSVTNLTFIDGKSDLKTVVSTQLTRHFGQIVADIGRTMMGYDFLKMIDQATEASCDQSYFELLQNALEALHEQTEEPELVRVWFMMRLLEVSGAGLNLERQANGKEFDEDEQYQFSFDDHAFFAHPSGHFGPKTIKFLRLLTKVSKPANLIQISEAKALAAEVQSLLEQCVREGALQR